MFECSHLIWLRSHSRTVKAVKHFCLDRLVNINNVQCKRPLTSAQLEKLSDRFCVMIACLAAKKELRLHANIDQFYYMQKLVELKLMVTILNGSCPAETLLHEKIHDRYRKMYCTWKKDVRYLGRYLRAAQADLTRQQACEQVELC